MNTRIKYLLTAALILAIGISFTLCLKEEETIDPSKSQIADIKSLEVFTNSENRLVGVFDMGNIGDDSVVCYVGGDYRGVLFFDSPGFKKRHKTNGVWEELGLSYAGILQARMLEPGDVARFQVGLDILTKDPDYRDYEFKMGMGEFWSDAFELP